MRLIANATSLICIFSFAIILTGCWDRKTMDPDEVYKYWTGEKPGAGVKLLRGQYWQSAHWTKEYIMYLELTVPNDWWEGFRTQNKLSLTKANWDVPSDAPTWFKPPHPYQMWKLPDEYQQSRYFKDSLSDTLFIYEIQL